MRNADVYTHYEKVRILATRSLQISQGAPILTKVPAGMTSPLDIARIEWEKTTIPIDVKKREF